MHDAARPLTPPDVVARVLAALAGGAARSSRCSRSSTPPSRSAPDGVVTGALPREQIRRVQTPQGFHRATLVAAYAGCPSTTPS